MGFTVSLCRLCCFCAKLLNDVLGMSKIVAERNAQSKEVERLLSHVHIWEVYLCLMEWCFYYAGSKYFCYTFNYCVILLILQLTLVLIHSVNQKLVPKEHPRDLLRGCLMTSFYLLMIRLFLLHNDNSCLLASFSDRGRMFSNESS